MDNKNLRVKIFFLAFSILVLELLVSRIADFHLGHFNSYLAIPITLMGLALGSLYVHLKKDAIENFDFRKSLGVLVISSTVLLLFLFFLFSTIFSVYGIYLHRYIGNHIYIKTFLFILFFIGIFFSFGKIITMLYYSGREDIGKLYATDLVGASLACFLVPVLLHSIDLPKLFFLFFLGIAVLYVFSMQLDSAKRKLAIGGAVFFAFLCTLMINMFDKQTKITISNRYKVDVVETGWNEYSRVSLIRVQHKRKRHKVSYKIIHDNAHSNVHVWPFRNRKRDPKRLEGIESPFILKRKTDDILVMFAGCGAEMIRFHEFTHGRADITGVEINPLVVSLARNNPLIRGYRIKQFHDLPNVHMAVAEGRSFLNQNNKKFDVVYIGSNAETSSQLTGHSRKFLDTQEAHKLYLDHLKPGGLLVLDHQPIRWQISSFKKIFRDQNLGDFSECVIIMTSLGGDHDMLISPTGFTREEIDSIKNFKKNSEKRIIYAPGYEKSRRFYKRLVTGPIHSRYRVVTDNRPYLHPIDFAGYTPFLDSAKIKKKRSFVNWMKYYMSWIKITTLLVICLIAVAFIGVSYSKRRDQLPVAVLVYLIVSGFCFMLAEIIILAKLELFLQNPLVSMATVISIFLLASGAGSALFKQVTGKVSIKLLPFVICAILVLDIFLLDVVNAQLLWLPLVVKILLTVIIVAPLALCLGIFYPYAVSLLSTDAYEKAIPITYGISTMSSVIGASFAMTMMINVGFNSMLVYAVVGYAMLGIFIVAYNKLATRFAF